MLHYVGFLEKHLYVELGEGLRKEKGERDLK
jgi:hypothetical protein